MIKQEKQNVEIHFTDFDIVKINQEYFEKQKNKTETTKILIPLLTIESNQSIPQNSPNQQNNSNILNNTQTSLITNVSVIPPVNPKLKVWIKDFDLIQLHEKIELNIKFMNGSKLPTFKEFYKFCKSENIENSFLLCREFEKSNDYLITKKYAHLSYLLDGALKEFKFKNETINIIHLETLDSNIIFKLDEIFRNNNGEFLNMIINLLINVDSKQNLVIQKKIINSLNHIGFNKDVVDKIVKIIKTLEDFINGNCYKI